MSFSLSTFSCNCLSLYLQYVQYIAESASATVRLSDQARIPDPPYTVLY